MSDYRYALEDTIYEMPLVTAVTLAQRPDSRTEDEKRTDAEAVLEARISGLEICVVELLDTVRAMSDAAALVALRRGAPVQPPPVAVSSRLEARLQAIEAAIRYHADVLLVVSARQEMGQL